MDVDGNLKAIFIAAGILIANTLLGYYWAPYGLLLSPIIITAIALILVAVPKQILALASSTFICLFVSINDIALKLTAGGNHDGEGQGLANLLLFIGLIPCLLIIISIAFSNKNEPVIRRILAVLLFPVAMALHIALFANLGQTMQ